jgi:hypothetical protein
MNPTKLVLHFSDFPVIFYAIYKNQQNCNTIGVSFCTETPGNIEFVAMWPLPWRAAAPAQIPAHR